MGGRLCLMGGLVVVRGRFRLGLCICWMSGPVGGLAGSRVWVVGTRVVFVVVGVGLVVVVAVVVLGSLRTSH